jgi:cobalt-zinc-cadmium efflux system membrane fusion protein
MKFIPIIAMTLLLMIAAGCHRETTAQPAGETPPPNEVWVTPKQIEEAGIQTTEVGEQQLRNALLTTGRITFSDTRVAHVFSPVTGRVTNLYASLGQTVHRGDALASIESPDLGTAVSDLEKAEADLAAARRDYERQKELYDAHAAAQRDFEAAEATYRKAKAERDRAAEKSHLLLVSDKSKTTQAYLLRSPIDGQVVARALNPGMEVQGQYSGGASVELFTIGNLDRVWVLADIFEVDLSRVKNGAPVTINVVSYPDRQFTGTVDWISGSLDPTTRTAKVRCTIDNSSHVLRPEMFATVSVATDTQPHLAIPRSAVLRLGDQMVAFVDAGESPRGARRFERRVIAVDETQAGMYVAVLRGLTPGERVVSSGAIILSGSAT